METHIDVPLLEFRNINKQYPGVKAVDDVSFAVRRGEVVALMGMNGAGKSTLVKILSGAETRDTGEILIDGKPLPMKYSPNEARKFGVGIIYQELSVLSELTVAENIFLNREFVKSGWFPYIHYKKMHEEARKQLDKLDAGHIDVKRKAGDLALPEKQMVEIAKALATDCKILIMDEPTTSLTAEETNRLFDVIQSLKKHGVCVIYISHRMNEIFRICDRAVVMRDGKLVDSFDIRQVTQEQIVESMAGRKIQTTSAGSRSVESTEERKKLLEVRNVTDHKWIRDISFDLYEGEVLGIGGLVGSKRTELARLIFGADKGFHGELRIEGRNVRLDHPGKAIRNGLGYLSENRKEDGLNLGRTLKENIILTDLKSVSSYMLWNQKKTLEIFKKYQDLMNIKGTADTHVGQLSGGNQQKVAIAKWMHAGCRVIIFDEPTRGVDVAAKAEIYKMIRNYAKEGNGAIVISSEVEELVEVSDRVLIMSKGEITAELRGEEITHDNILSRITSQFERKIV
jgi:ribose transport system ATP-binding protein